MGQQSEVGDHPPENGRVLSYLPHIDTFKSEEEAQVDLPARCDEPLLRKTCPRVAQSRSQSDRRYLDSFTAIKVAVQFLSCPVWKTTNRQPRSI